MKKIQFPLYTISALVSGCETMSELKKVHFAVLMRKVFSF